MTIKVLDAICGSGKTTAMLKHIVNNLDRKYMFVTPLLEESEGRIPKEMAKLCKEVHGIPYTNFKYTFSTPRPAKERTKQEHLKELVIAGRNISTTHSLFSMLTKEIIQLIIEQNYILVIDEAIECVGTISDHYNKSDVHALLAGDFVQVDKESTRGRLLWREDKYPNHNGKYGLVRTMCHMGALYSFKDKFLMTEYPPTLLKGLQDVYVLTYMFNGSDMRCWLELNDIPYEYISRKEWSVEREEEIIEVVSKGGFELLKHRKLDKLLEQQTRSSLSLSWFENALAGEVKPYKTVMQSLVSMQGMKKGDVFWTTFKEHEHKLRGRGYTLGAVPEQSAWIAKNTRATNAYSKYQMAMFACNSYRNPLICRYLSSYGVDYAYDEWSTSELVQFIFRGRIRTLQPQKVVILSRRMQELFTKWQRSLI